MKIKREINRKRIFLYYAIAIVLPSFLLGILAYRGVKNDQALVERELRRKFLETGQQVFQELEASLLNIENRFNQLKIPETLLQQKIFDDSILTRFCKMFPIVSGIFCFENNDNLCLFNNELLYFPDGYFSENRVPSSAALKPFSEGVQFEFNSKAYDKAFQSYSGQLRTTKQNQGRGELLNAMARVAKKQGNFVSARAIYDSIQNNYSYILIQNKIPLGIVAYLEKSNCYLQLTDTVSALENSVRLLRKLSNRNWELEKSYYLDFLSKTNKLISESINSKNSQIVRDCFEL